MPTPVPFPMQGEASHSSAIGMPTLLSTRRESNESRAGSRSIVLKVPSNRAGEKLERNREMIRHARGMAELKERNRQLFCLVTSGHGPADGDAEVAQLGADA